MKIEIARARIPWVDEKLKATGFGIYDLSQNSGYVVHARVTNRDGRKVLLIFTDEDIDKLIEARAKKDSFMEERK